jgi:hypothetical protein
MMFSVPDRDLHKYVDKVGIGIGIDSCCGFDADSDSDPDPDAYFYASLLGRSLPRDSRWRIEDACIPFSYFGNKNDALLAMASLGGYSLLAQAPPPAIPDLEPVVPTTGETLDDASITAQNVLIAKLVADVRGVTSVQNQMTIENVPKDPSQFVGLRLQTLPVSSADKLPDWSGFSPWRRAMRLSTVTLRDHTEGIRR